MQNANGAPAELIHSPYQRCSVSYSILHRFGFIFHDAGSAGFHISCTFSERRLYIRYRLEAPQDTAQHFDLALHGVECMCGQYQYQCQSIEEDQRVMATSLFFVIPY